MKTHFGSGFNSLYDIMVNPNISLFGHTWKSYDFLNIAGVIFGGMVVLGVSFFQSISIYPVLYILLLIFLFSAVLYTAHEFYKFKIPLISWIKRGIYHYIIISFALALGLLTFINQPILIYLDILSCGIATAQIIGRFGCYMTGCCHGLPHHLGVRYYSKHYKEQRNYFMYGIRLIPVQLFESISLFLLLLLMLNLFHQTSGTVFITYILGYGFIRFLLDFFRADLGRIYWRGMSEAQWTALVTVIAVLFLGYLDKDINLLLGHLLMMTLIAGGVLISIFYFRSKKYNILHLYSPNEVYSIVQIYKRLNFLMIKVKEERHNIDKSISYSECTTAALILQFAIIRDKDNLNCIIAITHPTIVLSKFTKSKVIELFSDIHDSIESDFKIES